MNLICICADTFRADIITVSDPYETKDVASDHPEVVRDRRRRLEDFLGGPLPYAYAHQPERRNVVTLGRHLEIRRRLGMPIQEDE